MVPWVDGPGVLDLPGGRRIRGRGLRRPRPEGQDPELGVYLLGRDPGPFPWEHQWVRWADFRTPASSEQAVAVLGAAYERAASVRVEVACEGGVGRTGTALALMAVLAGIPPGEAVAWVRQRYHPRAVETPWQRRWVQRIGAQVGPERRDRSRSRARWRSQA
jgi:protein-tyrosine phosphatase